MHFLKVAFSWASDPIPKLVTMKKTVLSAALLGAGLLSGCSMTAPGNVRVHEVLLYGGTQERIAWVYGTLNSASGSLKVNTSALEVRPQVSDPLAIDGTLSVNGKATYRLPTGTLAQPLSLTRRSDGRFNGAPLNSAEISAVYYTDGRNWQKLSAWNGLVTATPVSGLQGVGNLTDAEANALGGALLNQGSLAVAVLNESGVPDGPLTIEPKPQEYLRTALYVLPNVATVTVAANPPISLNPKPPVTTPVPPTTPVTGASVNLTELASGAYAKVTSFTVQVATNQTAANALFAQAYGNQSGTPSVSSVSGGTVVGVFMGQRPTGGYGIKVVSASASGGVLTLVVQVRSPGPGSITTQAITSPWTIVRVPGTYTQVNLVDEQGRPLQIAPDGGGNTR